MSLASAFRRRGTPTRVRPVPKQVPGLQSWFDASQIIGQADSSLVASWTDLSGSGFNVTQGTGANQPTYYSTTTSKLINSLPAVWFNGTSDSLSNNVISFPANTPMTILIVCQLGSIPAAGSTFVRPYDGIGSEFTVFLSSGTAWTLQDNGVGIASSSGPDLNPHFFTGVFNGASSSLRQDGINIASGTVGTLGLSGLILGSNNGAPLSIDYWPGAIAEMLVYQGALTGAQILTLESYLKTKWISAARPSGLVGSWVGNTWSSAGNQWAMPGLNHMAVTPTGGTVVTLIDWEEGVREVRTYSGSPTTINASNYTYMHNNDIPNGGNGIATDGTYVYAAVTYLNSAGIQRYNISDLSIAPFTGADGYPETGCPPQNCWRIVNVGASYEFLGQFTIDITNQELYVIDPHDTAGNPNAKLNASGTTIEGATVKVYSTANASVLTLLRSWACARVRSISYDGQGGIWAIQQEDASNLRTISRFNGTTGAQLTTLGNAVPNAMTVACDISGNRLLVADNGSDQNIKVWNNLVSPVAGTAIGVVGGILAGPTPGAFGSLRFVDPKCVAVDNSGNYYVGQSPSSGWAVDGNYDGMNGHGRGLVLEAYNNSNARQWYVFGHPYTSTAALDDNTQADVYDAYWHYSFNPNTSAWAPVGYLVNKFTYSGDQRFTDVGNGSWIKHPLVRYIAGNKFLFIRQGDPDSGNLAMWIYRFTSGTGEIAIPAGAISTRSPAMGVGGSTEFIWRDLNGNGKADAGEYFTPVGGAAFTAMDWTIDAAAGVWQSLGSTIRRFRNQGLDANGCPIYDYAHLDTWSLPSPYTEVDRVAYDSANDILYVLGYSAALPRPAGENTKFAGRLLTRFNGWAGTRTTAWSIAVNDYDTTNSQAAHKTIAMDWAGSYIFVAYFTEFATNPQNADIYVYDIATGTKQTVFQPSTLTSLGSRSGNIDVTCGINAHKIGSTYYVFTEDDGWDKTIVYEWTP